MGRVGRRGCPRADLGDHSITQARDGGDVGRVLGVVAQEAAQRGDGLVYGVGGDDDVGPDLGEEVVDADDFAGVLGEAEQETHGANFDAGSFAVAHDLAGGGIDVPGANAKWGCGWAFHAG